MSHGQYKPKCSLVTSFYNLKSLLRVSTSQFPRYGLWLLDTRLPPCLNAVSRLIVALNPIKRVQRRQRGRLIEQDPALPPPR